MAHGDQEDGAPHLSSCERSYEGSLTKGNVKQPFEGLTIIKKFPSKKNAVYLAERDGRSLVLKLYGNGRWKNELNVLREARGAGIAVPRIIDAGERAILMELIPGRSVNDYFNDDPSSEIVLGVADWLAGFHRAFETNGAVRLKSDAIFKNFIVSGRIYGVDFELSRPGRPEEDVGEALAYLLDTDPMFTPEKYGMGRSFIERYERASGMGLRDVEKDVARSLAEASEFRPARRDLLLKKARDIESSRPFTLER